MKTLKAISAFKTIKIMAKKIKNLFKIIYSEDHPKFRIKIRNNHFKII